MDEGCKSKKCAISLCSVSVWGSDYMGFIVCVCVCVCVCVHRCVAVITAQVVEGPCYLH